MLFNSAPFAYFFVVVAVLYFAVPYRARVGFLVAASTVFYAAFVPAYLVVLASIIVVDYLAARAMEPATGRRRKAWLALSVAANVGLLIAFRYLTFLGRTLAWGLGLFGWRTPSPVVAFVVPLGLSFHTLQAMAYTIEVYRGRFAAERSLPRYALYVMFFPQLVAGPIERPQGLIPQLGEPRDPEFARAVSGLGLMLWGMFKKVVIADMVATVVNCVYACPQRYSGPLLILATLFFGIQIYCDFSGYSDIAIGAARVLGIGIMTNFRQPYLATSVAEFWRRWHISLSTWFRDFVYIPLGGSRVGRGRWISNILVVFLLSGLWHGAAWTFVVWGLLHAVYLIAERLTQGPRDRIARAVGLARVPRLRAVLGALTVFVFVSVGWVFFRARSMSDAAYVLAHLLDWSGFAATDLWTLGLPRFEMALGFAMIAFLFTIDLALSTRGPLATRLWERRGFRWAGYLALIYGIVFFGVFGRVEFVYFQF